MLQRREIFPHVIEMNYQARQRLGCCVYLVHSQNEWMLIDIGYEDTVTMIIDMISQMDFALANCKYLVATHADVDHIQGLKKAKELLPAAKTVGHADTARILKIGDRVMSYAEITAQNVSVDFPTMQLDAIIGEGDQLTVGDLSLDVWHTPGHTNGQLSFLLQDLLFSGDNIYRDGGVGNIDAHHGSDIPCFIESLKRIRGSQAGWLLPSHGPPFRKNDELLNAAISRLEGYLHLSDFGTCAVDWPLIEEWDKELALGFDPERA